jgi:hypothetical protein
VDQTCQKCGAPVDAGKPFCPQCGAPQIRVAIPEPASPVVSPHHDVPPLANRIIWRSALPKAVGVALFSVLFVNAATLISFGLSLLAMALVGALTVFLYVRTSTAPVTAGMGIKLGIVAGFFAWVAHGGLALTVFLLDPAAIVKQVRTALEQSPASVDPQSRQMVERLLSSPEGPAAFMIMGLVMLFIVLIIMSAAGGAITGTITRSRQNR